MSTRYQFLLVSPDDARVWLARENGGWSMPYVETGRAWLPDAVATCQAQLRARYGVDAFVLREIRRSGNVVVCEAEALSTTASPQIEGGWRTREELLAGLPPGDHRLAVEEWLADRSDGLAPWQRRGWFARAREWIDASARRNGFALSGEITQVKAAWNRSLVLKLQTSIGTLYFKASLLRRPGEAVTLRALAPRWSSHLPALVDADEERGWMLTRGFDGAALAVREPPAGADAVRLFARLQIDQAGQVARWSERGCPDQGLAVMKRRLPKLLIEIPERLRECGVLTQAERDEIAAFAPQAAELCRRLSAFSTPRRSIHHEDFRAGNVLRNQNGDFIILDWHELVVAHPFFSLQRFLWFVERPEGASRHQILDGEGDELRRGLRDAYLEPFAVFEPRRRLLEAFRISCLLAPVYDTLRFEAGVDLDAVFRRGLDAESMRIARELMSHLLDVARSAKPRRRSKSAG